MNKTSLIHSGLEIWLFFVATSPATAQTRVQAQTLEQVQITVTRSVPGNVISLRQAVIASQLTATVLELPLLVGDHIDQNQLISKLDCIDNELILEQSKAELAALSANRVWAKQQLDRLNKLRQSNNASEEQINQKQAELNVAKSQINAQSIAIKIAQRQVEKCEIKAPFSGVVSEVHSEVGNFVTPGSAMVSLVDTKNIELDAEVSFAELNQIKNAEQQFFLFQKQTYPVSIRTTLVVIDSLTQNRHMRLKFTENKPLPGSTGRLQWTLPGTIIPAALVVVRDNQSGIFVIDQTSDSGPVALFQKIPGVKQGQPAVVDLVPETLIVTDGRFSLVDGDKVIID